MSISVSSQRVAAANLFANTEAGVSAEIKTLKGKELLEDEKRSNQLFDYYVPDSIRDYFSSIGVHTSVNSYRVHPHPISKMLENHILYNVFQHLLGDKNLFVSCKENKVNLILNRKGSGTRGVRYNRYVTAKDRFRYWDGNTELDLSFLPKLLETAQGADTCFVHDEVHYWSLEDMQEFLGHMESVKRVVYSIIYPVELHMGLEVSLNPSKYQFDKRGTYFLWCPDGKANGSYIQPVNDWLLSTSKIEDSKLRGWSITRLETFGAHHVFAAVREGGLSEPEDTYNDFECVNPNDVFGVFAITRFPRLRSDVVKAVFSFLLALKKPDANSAVAKCRQISRGDESPDEIFFLGMLARKIQSSDVFSGKCKFDAVEFMLESFLHCIGTKWLYLLNRAEYDRRDVHHLFSSIEPAKFIVKKTFRAYKKGLKIQREIAQEVLEMKLDFNTDPICNIVKIPENELGWVPGSLKGESWVPDALKGWKVGSGGEYQCTTVIDARYADHGDIFFAYVRRLRDFYKNPSKPWESRIGILGKSSTLRECYRVFNWSHGWFRTYKMLGEPDYDSMFLNGEISFERLQEIREGAKKKVHEESDDEEESEERGRLECSCGEKMPIYSSDVRYKAEGEGDSLKGRVAWFYSRDGEGYTYNGGNHTSKGWNAQLDEIIEKCGYSASAFNHCLYQEYVKGGKINFHADDEEVYPLDNPILTVNLTGEAVFSVKCGGGMGNAKLRGTEYFLMPNGFQRSHKHAVECTTQRSSMTFRSTKSIVLQNKRTDEGSDISEYKEEMDESNTLEGISEARGVCVLNALSAHLAIEPTNITAMVAEADPRCAAALSKGGVTLATFLDICYHLNMAACIFSERGSVVLNGDRVRGSFELQNNHLKLVEDGPQLSGLGDAYLLNPDCSELFFKPDIKLAETLRNSFHNSFTGVVIPNHNIKGKLKEGEKCQVYAIWGFAGSGKSHYVQALMRSRTPYRALIISPRKALALDWIDKISKRHRVCTYEVALSYLHLYEHVILDEINLYPEGYLDLVLCLARFKSVMVLGDPLQSEYYNKKDRIVLAGPGSVFSRFEGENRYLLYSYRLPKNQSYFGIKCLGPGDASYFTKGNVMVASRSEKDKWKNSFTIGEAQGLSFESARLIGSSALTKVENGMAMVALTRCRNGLSLPSRKEPFYASSFLSKVMNKKIITRSDLLGELEKKMSSVKIIEEPALLNDDEVDLGRKLRLDPMLKALMSWVDPVEIEEEEIEPEVIKKEGMRTHLPISERSNALYSSTLKSKEEREALTDVHGPTQQIDDQGGKDPRDNPGPLSYKSRYLDHKMDDDATFFLSVKKRLRFCDYLRNMSKYESKKVHGDQLFSIFKEFLKLPAHVEPSSLDFALEEFNKKRLQKSAALIGSHSDRSEISWPSNYVRIFLKDQMCTKLEKRGVDAKAGQLIACFSHAVLFHFGPKIRQAERTMYNLLPRNWLVYSQKNYDDLDEWCKTHCLGKMGTDSDYTAFDQSQDSVVLAFEVRLLEYLGWSEELVNEYKELKLMIGSRLGDLSVMRFSGEFGTFFLNTMFNIMYTILKYEITLDQPIAFAGDDMYAPGDLREKSKYKHILEDKKIIKLEAKVNRSTKPLFCGWRMTPYGIIKEPNLLLDRWRIAEEKGTLDDCIVNYSLEASYGYRLIDYLFDVEVDVDAQCELTRLIIKNKRKLPDRFQKLFSSDGDVSSDDDEGNAFTLEIEGK
ncbi:replicase [Blueberry green mosaic associated virus]|uniref:ORF1 protein n=1 Tax=Blueberry green mosaic associated virus TaxID=2605718 RepID=A0AAF1DAW3_9VIRU|nr:replicase [Blueberry green mosaic associated virus]QEH60473.1 replicase [Blueberry green mosaic associated virus]